MLDDIAAAIAVREERLTLGRTELVVKGLEFASDVAGWDNTQLIYHLVVACTFGPDGEPAFSDADIPALKAGDKARLLPLFQAVSRVNGLDAEAEAKNSTAAPA